MVSQKHVQTIAEVLLQKIPLVAPIPSVPFEPIKVKKGKGDEEEFVLLYSDCQVGIKTATFNSEVFKRRLEKLTRTVLKILYLHRRSHPVRNLNIFMLGDNVHNENIMRFLDLEEFEMTVSQQMFGVWIPSTIAMLREFLRHFREVRVWCVRGNHGSMSRPYAERTNLDDFCYYYLKQAFSKNKRIKFNIAKNFYNIANILGWKFLLVHGDTIPMHLTLPWYGITTRVLRWQGSIGDFDFVCMGHFHNASVLYWNDKIIFTNGTFLSSDEYSIRNLGLSGTTCQLLLGLHERQGVSFVRFVRLI